MTAKNIDHLVDYLKNTEYYAPLSRIRQSGASTLADYELALDLYYFSMMWKERKGNWDKKDKEMLTKELGAKIDLLNLQWIYRAKKYYHMLAPDIYTLLIPIQHKLSNQEFKDLVEAPSVEEFKRRLNETYYGKKYEFGEQVQIESIVNECVEHILTIAYRNHPYSLASIQQYLFLRRKRFIRSPRHWNVFAMDYRNGRHYSIWCKSNDVKEVMHHDRKDEILKHFRTEN